MYAWGFTGCSGGCIGMYNVAACHTAVYGAYVKFGARLHCFLELLFLNSGFRIQSSRLGL